MVKRLKNIYEASKLNNIEKVKQCVNMGSECFIQYLTATKLTRNMSNATAGRFKAGESDVSPMSGRKIKLKLDGVFDIPYTS